ncbi:hypothetical protein BJ508DRAFT_382057 [Ascobolus immersus RN42]|uniref:Uncharacterized protein n=1 Tax=Ascobolus immersus RN42 TaxID=1160509 RepID=A0A3N4HDR3_ASCIM|nr:hypothetical protein BJ508DRAFT_382057 [Ascobolus immersus RN42]
MTAANTNTTPKTPHKAAPSKQSTAPVSNGSSSKQPLSAHNRPKPPPPSRSQPSTTTRPPPPLLPKHRQHPEATLNALITHHATDTDPYHALILDQDLGVVSDLIRAKRWRELEGGIKAWKELDRFMAWRSCEKLGAEYTFSTIREAAAMSSIKYCPGQRENVQTGQSAVRTAGRRHLTKRQPRTINKIARAHAPPPSNTQTITSDS